MSNRIMLFQLTRRMVKETMFVLRAKIWCQIRISLRLEWEKRQGRGEKSAQEEEQISYLYEFDYGVSDRVYTWIGVQVQVCRIPPELH